MIKYWEIVAKEIDRLIQETVTKLHTQAAHSVLPSRKFTGLHTDALELRYGLVHAQLREHSQTRRVIDIVDSEGVSRTHAVTWFPQLNGVNDVLADARKDIARGALVGKTIKAYGFSVSKPEILKGITILPVWLKQRFACEETQAFFCIYQFVACKEEVNSLYGVVCEIYSPDFMPVKKHKLEIANAEVDNTANLFREALNSYLFDSSNPN